MSLITVLIVVLIVLAIVVIAWWMLKGKDAQDANGVAPLKSGTVVDSLGHETVPGLDNSNGVLNKDEETK